MNKAHSPINWENYPSENTPINESNLNKMDRSIGVIDDRVIELDNTKASKDEISSVISDVEYDEQGTALEFTRKNGDVKKIAISNVVVDEALSEKSTNPVQNKVVTKEMNRLSEEKADKSYVVSVFEQLKQLILNGDIESAVAVLDEAILDLSTLA